MQGFSITLEHVPNLDALPHSRAVALSIASDIMGSYSEYTCNIRYPNDVNISHSMSSYIGLGVLEG